METKKQNLFQKLWGGSLPDMNLETKVALTQSSLYETGAVIFIAACLIMLAYFTFNKLFK